MIHVISGVPIHALIVHVAIVLIPLSAIGVILIAARPKALRLFGVATVIGATVGVLASVISKTSGKDLRQRVGWPQEQVDYGNTYSIAAVAFLLLLVAFWLIARGVPLNRNRPLWLKVVGATLVLAAIVMSYLNVFYYLLALKKYLVTGN